MNKPVVRPALITTAFSVLIVLAASVVVACGSSSSDDSSASPAAGSATKTASPAAQRTPKNALPDGPLQVLTIEVSQPVADLGTISLNTPVRTGWVLRNTGTTPVSIGRPSIEVLEGC